MSGPGDEEFGDLGRRLSVLAAIIGAVMVMGVVLDLVANIAGWDLIDPKFGTLIRVLQVVGALLGVGLSVFLRVKRLSRRQVLRLAAICEVSTCFLGAFLERLHFDFGAIRFPISIVLVPIFFFAVAVPQAPKTRYLTTTLSLVGMVLGNLLATLTLRPVPDWGFWAFSFNATIGLGIATLGVWRIVYGMGERLKEARRVGSYRLTEQLTVGGMGEVWRAEHTLLARPAAVKLIRGDQLGRNADVAMARFEREAQATAQLRSPHTIELFDFGWTPDGTFYYVMELLEGTDLDRLVQAHGPLSEARTVYILRQACFSLAEAHDAGLIHRDIKPANIFVCQLGGLYDFVKVLDFGLVKPLEQQESLSELETEPGARSVSGSAPSVTEAGSAPGTPAFMAPEQAVAGALDARTDIYALGCVAYWLLTGDRVFSGDSAIDLLHAHIQKQPEAPSSAARSTVSPQMDALVLSCLAKSPTKRPQSIGELAERLDALAVTDSWSSKDSQRWWDTRSAELEAEALEPTRTQAGVTQQL